MQNHGAGPGGAFPGWQDQGAPARLAGAATWPQHLRQPALCLAPGRRVLVMQAGQVWDGRIACSRAGQAGQGQVRADGAGRAKHGRAGWRTAQARQNTAGHGGGQHRCSQVSMAACISAGQSACSRAVTQACAWGPPSCTAWSSSLAASSGLAQILRVACCTERRLVCAPPPRATAQQQQRRRRWMQGAGDHGSALCRVPSGTTQRHPHAVQCKSRRRTIDLARDEL